MNMHVLLIEPDVLLAKAYTQAFQQTGMSVRAVADAQSAINAADMKRPDVVVLELQLVAHNGIEFLHEFRSYAEWQDIPVIINSMIHPRVLTGFVSLRRDLGVEECYYKPMISLATLTAAVLASAQRAMIKQPQERNP